MQQLLIILIVVEGYDGHAVLDLVREWVDRVVDQHDLVQGKALKDTQIFHIVAVVGLQARVTVESKGKQGVLWINKIEDCVSIWLMRSCEDANLEQFSSLFETLQKVWPYIESSLKLFINKILHQQVQVLLES